MSHGRFAQFPRGPRLRYACEPQTAACLSFDASGCYGSMSAELAAIHAGEPYRLMMAECEAVYRRNRRRSRSAAGGEAR